MILPKFVTNPIEKVSFVSYIAIFLGVVLLLALPYCFLTPCNDVIDINDSVDLVKNVVDIRKIRYYNIFY